MASDEILDRLTESARRVRSLGQRAGRRRHRRAPVEGPQGVRELLRFHPAAARDVYLTEAAAERYPEILRSAHAAHVPVHFVTPAVAATMSGDAQGVLAVMSTEGSPAQVDLDGLLAFRSAESLGMLAYLAQASDPGNVGTVIRAADAAGAGGVLLGRGSVEHVNPKVLRSTAGSFFHLPVVADAALADALPRLREAGFLILAADARADHVLDDLLDLATGLVTDEVAAGLAGAPDLRRPVVWLFGNEAHGLASWEVHQADATVRVPISGHAESLNLAVAAALCLYATARAQRVARRFGDAGRAERR